MDKCLPFGSSISCAIFQAVSDAIAFIVTVKVKKVNVNYLDDYLFAAVMKRNVIDRFRHFWTFVHSSISQWLWRKLSRLQPFWFSWFTAGYTKTASLYTN